MILVIISLFVVWFLVGKDTEHRTSFFLSIGLLLSYIVAVMANLAPIIDILLENNTALRVYPPFAFPFTIQQFRDYDAGMFNYILAFGWPEGISFFQFPIQDDQSEYIHLQHYTAGLWIGLILLLFAFLTVFFLLGLDKRGILQENKVQASSAFLLAIHQLALLTLVFLILETPLYMLGALVVLAITAYPMLQQIRIKQDT